MMSPSPLRLILSSSSLIVSPPAIFTCSYLTMLHVETVHKDDISREQLKELLYEEIMSFQPAPIT